MLRFLKLSSIRDLYRRLTKQKTRCLPKKPLPKEPLLKEPLPKEPLPKEPPTTEAGAIEVVEEPPTHSAIEEPPADAAKEVAMEDLTREPLPEAPIESRTTTTTTTKSKKKHPKATAQNNRLLALPIELRLQIYDELLAIPRTVHALERKDKSNLHNIRKFDKELFTRRARLRYKFSTPYIGHYDPRTTTFAARFSDDEHCTHRIWLSERNSAAAHGALLPGQQGTSTGAPANRLAEGGDLVFALCCEATIRRNYWMWGLVHDRLCRGPEIHILELEFPKICSAITVMKALLLSRVEGWRELRKLSMLRIGIRSGNGGPLNELEMAVLWSLAADLRVEMERKVLLRRGPKVDIAW